MLRNTCSRENHTHTHASTATVAAGPRDTPPHWISQRDYQQTWSVDSKMGWLGGRWGGQETKRGRMLTTSAVQNTKTNTYNMCMISNVTQHLFLCSVCVYNPPLRPSQC